jgi:ribonuclease R
LIVRGVIRGTRQGFAFLTPEDGGEDIYVAQESLGGAIHGDRVEATLFRRSPRDFRPEAFIERIIERGHPIHTGNVLRLARTPFVVPDSPLLPERIRLKTGAETAPSGSKIVFRLEDNVPGAPLVATVERVLGDAEDPALDVAVVSTAHKLPARFPDGVIEEAVEVAGREDPADVSARTSYRDRLVITIDPEDAKDFDDAISLQNDADGWHLQVHIADVSFYVPEGGEVDSEAARRGTSVYFPGGVIPMLPEVLSTRMASLVPNEDRRVLTVEIDLANNGDVRTTRLREGLIRSGARLHYKQAQEMLEREVGDPEVRAAVRRMHMLSSILRRRRFEQGGFDLEVPESEMRLDARGVPVALFRHESLESHRLIEEFMILANRAVASCAVQRGAPLLFRVHGEPDPQSLVRFAEVALTLVPSASSRDVATLPGLRRFLSGLPRAALTRIVHSFFLRSMKQAVYSPIDIGHFGLGIDRYCHFTSPIRRYPDLVNHRIVRWMIRHPRADAGRAPEMRKIAERAAEIGLSSTVAERNAEGAERALIRLKILRWAQAHIGEIGWGRVTGLLPGGIFVEREDVPVEGFVRREGLRPGARFDEDRLAFVEGRSQWELRLGDRVEVQIARVDLRDRHLDFVLVGRAGREKGKSPESAAPRSKIGPRPVRRAGEPVKSGADRRGRGEGQGGKGRSKTGPVKRKKKHADRGKGPARPRGIARGRPRRGGKR